jgi:hypothetical protein
MNVELEITDIFEKVLLRAEPHDISLAALPNVGDAVWIESKRWEVAKRSFYYHAWDRAKKESQF